MNPKIPLISILLSFFLAMALCGSSTAQVTDRDNKVVARNQRFGDDLRDSQKLREDYASVIYKNDCKAARKVLADSANIYQGLVDSVLGKDSYVKEFESEEGKQQANALKKLVEAITQQHTQVEKLAACPDADPAKAAPDQKPVTDGQATAVKDSGCSVFDKATRVNMLAALVPELMVIYKKRDESIASHSMTNYYPNRVHVWVQFLETYFALCATEDDLKAFPPQIALLVKVAPGTRFPDAGTPIIGEDAVRKLIETYNAKDIQEIRDKAAAGLGSGGDNSIKEKAQTTAGQTGGPGTVAKPTPTPPVTPPPTPVTPPKVADGPTPLAPVAPPPPPAKKTTSKKEKPGKKDGGTQPPAPTPPTPPPYTPPPGTTSPALPPVAGDPVEGFDVPGGTLRRSTTSLNLGKDGSGRDDVRPAVVFWVNTTDKKLCQDFRFYQFNRDDFDGAWGSDPLKPVNEDVKKLIHNGKPGLDKANGGYIMPGAWGADDYADRGADPASNAKFTSPEGNVISAGPFTEDTFRKTVDAPGLKPSKAMVDAPRWQGSKPAEDYYEKFHPKSAEKPPAKQRLQATKPDAAEIGKLVVKQQFRTELHCKKPPPRICLGYVTWSYTETITYLWDWVEEAKPKDKADEFFPSNRPATGGKRKTAEELAAEEQARIKKWVPKRSSTSTIAVPIQMGAWTNDCTK